MDVFQHHGMKQEGEHTPTLSNLLKNFRLRVKRLRCYAAVCPDSRGKILLIRTTKTPRSNPLKGELVRAARLAISLAGEFQDQAIQVEGDALSLVNDTGVVSTEGRD
ncbi:hypothetical protein CJ030_MR4G024755 [Morella rubra]|uniref:Uncharacterized protein n=1 Tax=Morella rubra TaxID=262757 RepID=A0A6A1WRZ1_9ROSI|nr:hypothetical protein CJ030_MR4G024755 [Morella rubra]